MNFNPQLDLLDATKLFWSFVLEGKFHELEDLLAPDCRIQDQFSHTGRGLNGADKVVGKFQEVNQKINGAKIDPEMKYLQLMRNQTQARFMIIGSYGFMKICLGFALEWQHGIVVAVVVMRNTTTDIFLKDETSKPIVVTPPQATGTTPAAIKPADEAHTGPSATSTDEPAPAAVVATAAVEDTGRWYPGKNIKKRLSLVTAAKGEEAAAADVSPAPFRNQTIPANAAGGLGGTTGLDLKPPFLVPKPPMVPPTVTITVLKCTHLKSRLKRVITRPINCYAEVNVHECTRSTPVVSNSANPVFDARNGNNKFIFEIPNKPEFNARNGMIVITLKDKHALLSEDVLAVVYIPLISVKCSENALADSATNLCIPLDLFEQQKLGKKFISPRTGGNDEAAIARSKGRSISTDAKDKTNSNASVDITEETPCLFITVAKVDMQQWWMLAELKEREEEAGREKARSKDRRRLEREIENMRLNKKTKKKRALVPSDQKTIHPDHLCLREEWIDDATVDNCQSCNIEFGVMTRKHHCRLCGAVFCNGCSSFEARLLDTTEGNVVRICRDCYDNVANETTYHNNDHGADSDDSAEEVPVEFRKDRDRSPSVRLSGPSKNPNVLIGKGNVSVLPVKKSASKETAVSASKAVPASKAAPAAASASTSNPKPYIVGSYVANDSGTSSDDELSSDDCVGDEDMSEAKHRISSTDSAEGACLIS